MTTGAAQGQWRIATPVQKEQRLLPGLEGRGELGDEWRRQKTPGLDPLAAHIEEPHHGKLGRRMAAFSSPGIVFSRAS